MNKKSKNTQSWIDRNLSPGLLLANGLVLLLMILLFDGLPAKMVLFAAVISLNCLRGKRIRIWITAIFTSSLVLVNLYPPFGKVLVTIWGFPVTYENLMMGLGKGITLSSFLLIAKYAISRDLSFPGIPGKILARTLFFLSLMQEEHLKWEKGEFIDKIDRLVTDLWNKRGDMKSLERKHSTVPGKCFVVVHTLLMIILLYFI